MKAFKITDLLLQLAVVTGFAAYALAGGSGNWVLPAYVALGGLQMAGMVVHQVVGYGPKDSRRYNYHRFVLGLAGFCAVGCGLAFAGYSVGAEWITTVFGYAVFAIFAILLFVAPVMAAAYWAQCLIETRRLFRKPERIFA